jgi:dehydrogenase/reductase SDR family member 4
VLCSRRQGNVDAALSYLKTKGITRAVGMAAHVGKEGDIEKLLQLAERSFGGGVGSGNKKEGFKIDVLVSNAAVNPFAGSILDTPPEAIDKVLEINLKSAIMLCRLVVPKMPQDGTASIVFISSITAFRPEAPLGVYAVSKTALVALSKALAEELAPTVRVNCVAPGTVPTKFAAALTDDTGAESGGSGSGSGNAISPREIAISRTLLGRLGTPEDMAAAVAYLASVDASYVTGECLVVAGGMMASRL